MRRREFIAGLGLAAGWPLLAHAQQAMPMIGFVSITRPLGPMTDFSDRTFVAFREGLAEYGFVENQNFRLVGRAAGDQRDLLPIVCRELVNQKVSLFFTPQTAMLEAVKAATQSIPIVFSIGTDPVENGFVASLNKPGGNITGVFNLAMPTTGKRLEVLHELLPSAKKFAFLKDPGNATISKLVVPIIENAADSLGIGLIHVEARSPDEIEPAFDTAVRGGAEGMVLGADALFFCPSCTPIVALAARYRLPTIFVDEAAPKMGGLISYASDQDENHRIAGRYAGRILKGAKPADIPVQLSTKTILIINLKTAKALGITVPISLLARADQVVE
jgi:putative ABC transport system substrate-binding protein